MIHKKFQLPEELLTCDETNIVWMPDSLEAQIYRHVLTTVMCIMEDVLHSAEVVILGQTYHFSLISAVSSMKTQNMRKMVGGGKFEKYNQQPDAELENAELKRTASVCHDVDVI